MSYQVLARKWRPSNFSEVAGQAHVLKSLINALDNQRLHHAYLFTGTRGVGKTTLARILAKCLNCEEGVSSTPCEKCDSCVEISEGRFIDLIEVDAASRTKVEDTRELLENVQYTPARGRYKVYLIDEVHMLSNHSFNALLKTLEEPPPHVKFLFATTDPQKLPITILSRCLQFNLKNLSPKMISEYLVSVLKQEKIQNDEEALWQIATAAGGSMRDALTLVDQAISFCEGSVSAAGVVEMLGVPEQQQVFQLLAHMASGSVESVLKLVQIIAEQTPDYAHTLDSLLSLLHRVAIAQVMPDGIDNSFGDKEKVLELAGAIAAEDVQLYYQIGSKGREELRYSAEVRGTFEMLLLRMMVFSPSFVGNHVSDIEGTDALPSKTEKKKIVPTDKVDQVDSEPDLAAPILVSQPLDIQVSAEEVEQTDQSNIPVSSEKKPTGSEKAIEISQASVAQDDISLPSCDSPEQDKVIDSDLAKVDEDQTDASVNPGMTLGALSDRSWVLNFASIPASGIVANVLANMQLLSVEANRIKLRLDVNQSAVFSDELVAKIDTVLSDWLGEPVLAEIEIAEVDTETPALRAQRLRKEQHAEMVLEFRQDKNVKELLTRFSGTIAENSISSTTTEIKNGGEQ